MIIADGNRNAGSIDHSLIEAIRRAGFDVYSVYELRRGISDKPIIDLSRNPPRLILTEDKDFGEWVVAHFGHFTPLTTTRLRTRPVQTNAGDESENPPPA